MLFVILVINSVVATASILGALIALVKPQLISNSTTATDGESFYSQMYVVRALPLGIVLAILPFVTTGRFVAVLLFVGAFIQLADAFIGLLRRKLAMFFGPVLATIVHITCGLFFW